MTRWIDSDTLIRDLASAEIALHELDALFDECLPFWRGHANKDWELRPRAFRPLCGPEGAAVVGADGGPTFLPESSVLWHFVMRATPRHNDLPDWDDRLGWLLLAQHYGLPTRFLDWTRSLSMALFFAVEDEALDEKDGCLWALWTQEMNRHQVSQDGLVTPEDPALQGMLDAAFGRRASPKVMQRSAAPEPGPKDVMSLPGVLATAARQTDLRMMVQQSHFTVHGINKDLRAISFPVPVLVRYVIPAERKAGVREVLKRIGVTRSIVYPDLHSLAREIREGRYT